jgi:hypothetical protein
VTGLGSPDRELGFRGMIEAGFSPREAWDECRKAARDPEARAIIDLMGRSEEGREALQWSRDQWATYGLNPPWENP